MGKTTSSKKQTKKHHSTSIKRRTKRKRSTPTSNQQKNASPNSSNSGKITIATVTLADIKKAAKLSTGASGQILESQKQRQLVRVPSKSVRTKLLVEAADAISAKEGLALPSHGGRPWKCEVRVLDSTTVATKSNKKKHGPLFRWFRGKLELACLPHIIEKIEVIEVEDIKRCNYLSDEDTDDEEDCSDLVVSKSALQERSISTLSTLAWNDPDHQIPNVERIWTSPDHVKYYTRKAAMDHAEELVRRDKLIDRVLHGRGIRGSILKPFKPTKAAALEAGYFRFLRDGLWVVGQEEDWQKEREEVWSRRKGKMARTKATREEALRIKKEADPKKGDISDDVEVGVAAGLNQKGDVLTVDKNEDKQIDNYGTPGRAEQTNDSTQNNTSVASEINILLPPKVVQNVKVVTPADSPPDSSKARNSTNNRSVVSQGFVCSSAGKHFDDLTTSSAETTESSKMEAPPLAPKPSFRSHRLTPSKHWRLTQQQIDLCYNAAVEHYEKVMYTVKARALYSELADGFDLLRERGRGRFDMELPAFDEPKFKFLTDLEKASWMPVVRKILGDDVALVHKGVFLSLPGSEMQVYHQDGPHLTTKHQKPCHAVNVFIPLVDLTRKNGPTEFCLGTHILDYEYFAKEMVETPLTTAGTPIIFDYRLGHRGLGNSSGECRPLVYLTYSPSGGKEFKDSVNFSRKRYVKIGELLDKPLSRDERAKRRKRAIV